MLLHTNKGQMAATLEASLQNFSALDETDIPGVAAFLRKCLALDPKMRASAQELLEDSWIVES